MNGKMTDDDTARVRAYTDDKETINERRRGSETQADVIRRLVDGAGQDGTGVDAEDVIDALEDRIDALAYDGASGGETVTFDDVKNACSAAIQEELEDLRR